MIKRAIGAILLIVGYIYFISGDKNGFFYKTIEKFTKSQIEEIKKSSIKINDSSINTTSSKKSRARWF